jgi:hypothetical protein
VTKPTCTPLPDGNVQITGSGVISAHDASVLIVEIAKAAIQAHRRSGQTLPDRTQTEALVPYGWRGHESGQNRTHPLTCLTKRARSPISTGVGKSWLSSGGV